MFSSIALHCGVYFVLISRHRASKRVGFVFVRLVLLRLEFIYTRLVGLRAVNWNISVGILFVLSLCRRLLSLFSSAARFFFFAVIWLALPCQSPSAKLWVRLARRGRFI